MSNIMKSQIRWGQEEITIIFSIMIFTGDLNNFSGGDGGSHVPL